MPVRLIVEKETAAELAPYVEAMRRCEAAAQAKPPCRECLGHGLMVDHDGVTHRCETCRPKPEAPCGTCRGTGRIEVTNGELDYCPACDGR